MDKIGDLIGKRLNQHKLGDSARAGLIVSQANQFLRKRFPDSEEEIRAFRLKEGVLYIGTIGAVWSQELWGCQEMLLEEIRHEHGKKSVMKVVIKSLTTK